jgi:hypothetical protein
MSENGNKKQVAEIKEWNPKNWFERFLKIWASEKDGVRITAIISVEVLKW